MVGWPCTVVWTGRDPPANSWTGSNTQFHSQHLNINFIFDRLSGRSTCPDTMLLMQTVLVVRDTGTLSQWLNAFLQQAHTRLMKGRRCRRRSMASLSVSPCPPSLSLSLSGARQSSIYSLSRFVATSSVTVAGCCWVSASRPASRHQVTANVPECSDVTEATCFLSC